LIPALAAATGDERGERKRSYPTNYFPIHNVIIPPEF
jgi:hypothetical protein